MMSQYLYFSSFAGNIISAEKSSLELVAEKPSDRWGDVPRPMTGNTGHDTHNIGVHFPHNGSHSGIAAA